MSVFAPYNFVPLSRFIYLPHWADQVSHDVPFSDGISGTLTVELTCHTPTLVGGTQIPAIKEAPGRVEFFKDPNGNPIISGSSLKGMISSTLEIASFARFNRLDDKRYSVRDISSSSNFYLNKFTGRTKGGKAGWLKFNQNQACWEITPCNMARLNQQDIIDYYGIDLDSWVSKRNKKAHQRYQLLGGNRPIKFNTRPDNDKGTVAEPSQSGSFSGQLVVTGQPGQAFNKSKSAKKWEFVFYNPSSESKEIKASVIRDFLFIHSDSEEWKYWQKNGGKHSDSGIPVFYQEQKGEISSIGLSYLYKLAYQHSTHEAVTHTNKSHIRGSSPDLPELIFGKINDEEDASLKGRVNIGTAKIMGEPLYNGDLPATILNSPKPTFYPAYIRQPQADRSGKLSSPQEFKTFMDDDSELSGWKRYPTHEQSHIVRQQGKVGSREDENFTVQTRLIPVKVDTRFRFQVQLHNLREAELGALLWSLDFGERKEAFHSLGMGKPFGMGRVSLSLLDAELQPNQPSHFTPEELIAKARASFITLMNDAYHFVTQEHSWIKSPQLNEMLAMCTIQSQVNRDIGYMSVDEHTDAKSSQATHTLTTYSRTPFKPLNISTDELTQVNNELSLLTNEGYTQQLLDQQKAISEAAALAAQRQSMSPNDLLIMDLMKNLETAIQKYEIVLEKYEKPDQRKPREKVNRALEAVKKAVKSTPFNEQQTQQCLTLIEPLHTKKMLHDTKFLDRLVRALDQKEGD